MTDYTYSITEDFSNTHLQLADAVKELLDEDESITDLCVVYIYRGESSKLKYSQIFPQVSTILADSVWEFAEEEIAGEVIEDISNRDMNLNLEFSNFLNAWCDKNIKTPINYITNVKEIAVGIHSIEEGIFLEMPNL